MAETSSGYSYPMMYYQNHEYISLKEDDISQIRSSLDKFSSKVDEIKTLFDQYSALHTLDSIYVDKIQMMISWCDKTKEKIQIVSNNLYGFMSGMGDTEGSILSKIESELSQYSYMTPSRPDFLTWSAAPAQVASNAGQYVVDNSQKTVKTESNTEIKVEEQPTEIAAAPKLENMANEKDTTIEEPKVESSINEMQKLEDITSEKEAKIEEQNIDSSIDEMQKLESILRETQEEKEKQKIISLDENLFKGTPFYSNTDTVVANPVTPKQPVVTENETVGQSILGKSVDTSSTKKNENIIVNQNIFNGNNFFSKTTSAQDSVPAVSSSETKSENKETSNSSIFKGNDFFKSTSSAKENVSDNKIFNAQSKLAEILRRKGNGV